MAASETFPLGTPNKAAAAARARGIYLSLVANGWDATLAKFKKLSAAARTLNVEQPCTIGEFLEAIARTTTNQGTVEDYARAFRQIVSDIFGLSNNKRKYDYQSGGRAEWLSKVHAISLAQVTPAKIQEWKRSFLARAGSDAAALRTTRISLNATMRRARSLFSPRKLRHLTLTLPRPLPFEGVEFEARQSMKYRSEIDVQKLIAHARQELGNDDPEAYKVFLLAIGLGLRRKEIDLLEWPSFRWSENVVRIQPTRYFHPKSEDSIADLPVDPELMDIFRKYYAGAKGSFNRLMLEGCHVFHDVPMEPYGNIDHVIVSRCGIFAVETKTVSKPRLRDGKAGHRVIFDERCLRFPHRSDGSAAGQAEHQAKRLSRFLSEAIGERVSAEGILALPGWMVERKARSNVKVLNPKEIGKIVLDKSSPTSTEELRKRVAYQLDQRCRDVEF